VKKSKIAAKLVKVAANKVSKGKAISAKAISAKGSVGEAMGCISCGVMQSEFEVDRHGSNTGGGYWLTAARI